MRTALFLGVLSGALSLALAAAAQPDSGPAKVANTSAGQALTDANGMTLYTFTRDMIGYSNCNGDCAIAWPPFLAGPDAKAGGDWSIVHRDDGRLQWAYKGSALYRYSKDAAAGDAAGEAAGGGKWRVAKP